MKGVIKEACWQAKGLFSIAGSCCSHLVPLVDLGVQIGFVEVFSEPGVCTHPASESQVVGVLDGGLGSAVQGVLSVAAVARLELL